MTRKRKRKNPRQLLDHVTNVAIKFVRYADNTTYPDSTLYDLVHDLHYMSGAARRPGRTDSGYFRILGRKDMGGKELASLLAGWEQDDLLLLMGLLRDLIKARYAKQAETEEEQHFAEDALLGAINLIEEQCENGAVRAQIFSKPSSVAGGWMFTGRNIKDACLYARDWVIMNSGRRILKKHYGDRMAAAKEIIAFFLRRMYEPNLKQRLD